MTQVHCNGVLAGQVAVVTGASRSISRSISCSIGDAGTITDRIDCADRAIEEFQLQPANIC